MAKWRVYGSSAQRLYKVDYKGKEKIRYRLAKNASKEFDDNKCDHVQHQIHNHVQQSLLECQCHMMIVLSCMQFES